VRDVQTEEEFTAVPRRLKLEEADDAKWSIYVVRVNLTRYDQPSALKIGMVGNGTIGERRDEHNKKYGETELLDAWTLAHAVSGLPDPQGWRVVEQYEARLQFAPEFIDPQARLRRLRPDTLVYSFEWFEDDDRILQAVERYAPLPVTLPHGWTLARASVPTERLGETP
jgi:hypothetical protein